MREMRGTCFFSEWKPFSPSEGRFGEMGMGFLDFLGESQGWWTARERTMGGKGGCLFGGHEMSLGKGEIGKTCQ